MADHPSIAEQIQAVEWCEVHFEAVRKAARRVMRDSEADRMKLALEAAAETLRGFEFGSAITQ